MAQFGDFTVDRNSAKYVLGSGGTIISYATDEPAFEFNADGSYKGLLVEPAATNLLFYSEDFDNWSKNNVTVTANATVAPNGLTVANKIVENTANDRHQVYSGSGTAGSFSIYAKAAERSILGVYSGSFFSFDLSAGTATGSGASIESVGSGWFRCFATRTNSSSVYVGPSINTVVDDLSWTYTGDGTSGIYLWGAQLETGPIATSYIPTTTAQVTRVKDDITLGSASSLIGQTEGTLYVEVDWRLATGTFQNLVSINDGTLNNRFTIVNFNSPVQLRMYAIASGNNEVDQGVDSSGFSGIQKFAFAYADSDFELYRNGSSVSSDTSGSLAALATLTDIDIGQAATSVSTTNMWIRAVALYPTRLSDAECEALTTL